MREAGAGWRRSDDKTEAKSPASAHTAKSSRSCPLCLSGENSLGYTLFFFLSVPDQVITAKHGRFQYLGAKSSCCYYCYLIGNECT